MTHSVMPPICYNDEIECLQDMKSSIFENWASYQIQIKYYFFKYINNEVFTFHQKICISLSSQTSEMEITQFFVQKKQ